MLMDFLFGDWQGTLTLVVLGFSAALAFVYVPSPAKAYVVSLLLVCAAAIKIYSLGYTAGVEVEKGRCNVTLSAVSVENEKAVAAATIKAQQDAAANIANLKRVMDAKEAEAVRNEQAYQSALEAITKAPPSADGAAPDLILQAIGGKK